ncbi:MAG: Uma2 family endonuclease [Cytophagales bacterium]|jgi:Uma2 family endonuclease|nr:Uma2 family endonuclease [Cytophagales bacterium]
MLVVQTKEQTIPKMLIYEEWDGMPVYYKGYRQVLNGEKQPEEIMGSSALQTYIVSVILGFLYKNLSTEKFFIGTNEAGLHLVKGTNLSSDILIYEKKNLKITKESLHYFDTPPYMVIEIDVQADVKELFHTETNYFIRKTNKLREFGVQKVVWVFTEGKRLVIANDAKHWEMVTWDTPVEVAEGISFVLEDLVKAGGFDI